VAGESLVVGGRELRMQLRLAQCRLESPLEVRAATAAGEFGIDSGDCV
jgi:hypothetical protein